MCLLHQKAIELVYHDSNLKNYHHDGKFWYLFLWMVWLKKRRFRPLDWHPIIICRILCPYATALWMNLTPPMIICCFLAIPVLERRFLTNCIAKELLDSSHSVIYLTAVELFQCFEQQDFNKPDTSDTAIDSSYILDCDLLIIDDLGTEFANSYTSSRLFYCINERILRRKTRGYLNQPFALRYPQHVFGANFFAPHQCL